MENKSEKLSLQPKLIILDQGLGNIIHIFLSTFLAAYFYRISQDNMTYLAIYHIITFIVATIGAFLLADFIKRKNKVSLYRFGTFFKAFYILLIILLKENVIQYVWLIGICYGITIATTGFPFNMMESELVSEKERTKYMSYKYIIQEVLAVAIPVFLGAYITFTSYQVAAILVFVFTILKLILSYFIKNVHVESDKVDLKGFRKALKENPDKPIRKLFLIEFLNGMTVHGVLSLVVSLLIIYEVKTDLNLGIWTSLFSIATIVAMLLFSKKYDKHKPKMILGICAISIVTSFILLFFSINFTTIILYNLVYASAVKVMLSITNIRLFDYSNIEPFDKKYNTEYFIFREIYINFGRVFGYGLLLLVGLSHHLEYLKLLLLCTTIATIGIILISFRIHKKEQTLKN